MSDIYLTYADNVKAGLVLIFTLFHIGSFPYV